MHSFRGDLPLLVAMFALTLVVQAVRVLAIWAAGKAVGVDLSPRPYYVMGPLLFLVMLVPFTVNGLAVRESFFVSFLGSLGVGSDRAFATGFLFFVVTIALALPGRRDPAARRAAAAMSDVSVVVVTYNAMPWLEQCLESVRGVETVVVDHGSTDGTLELVRERFPEVALVEEENRGLAFGWNTGIARTAGRYVLLLNADAWLDEGALEALVAFADAPPGRGRRRAAAALSPTGASSAPCAAFRRSGGSRRSFSSCASSRPRTRALNAFYGAGFDHAEVREAEVLMGAVWLVRRAAIDEVGPADDAFFLFSEETDWAYRFRAAGWKVALLPGRGRDPRLRGLAQGPAVRREPPRPAPLPRASTAATRTRSARGGCCSSRCGCAARSTAASAAGCTARAPRGSRPGASAICSMTRCSLGLPLLGIARLLPEHGFGLWLRLAAATLVLLAAGTARRARARPAQLGGGVHVVGRARRRRARADVRRARVARR